jgi:hypothetical protein
MKRRSAGPLAAPTVTTSRTSDMKRGGSATDQLACKVMGWRLAPDRYIKPYRSWEPRWRFQPLERMADANRLLEQAAPQEYAMGATENGGFWARVRIAGVAGEARESSQARALTFAIARAIGIDPEGKG